MPARKRESEIEEEPAPCEGCAALQSERTELLTEIARLNDTPRMFNPTGDLNPIGVTEVTRHWCSLIPDHPDHPRPPFDPVLGWDTPEVLAWGKQRKEAE